MDHILQLRVERQSSPKLCNDRGVASFTSSADASLVTLALAAIASLALLFLSSFSSMATSSQDSSTLPARLLAAGCVFTSKTALFVLSNVVIVLLAADYRCRFVATAAPACRAASSGVLVLEKQAQHHHHQVQVEVEHCAVLSSAPCSETLGEHNEQEDEDRSTMSAKTLPDEERLSELELVRLGEEQDSRSSSLDETVDDDVEEPACETSQGLDGLEISELNKKFDEFIRSRRIKWVKEEAYLLLCEV